MKTTDEKTPTEVADTHEMLAQMCIDNGDKPGAEMHMEVAHAIRRLLPVAQWAQAVLTALNVGDVAKESLLHKKLREVMIASRSNVKDEQRAPKEDRR